MEYVPPAAGAAPPTRPAEEDRAPRALPAALAGAGAILLAGAVWAVATWGTYEPGDAIGYNLGLAGGLLMLVLFAYPLRKRVRALAFLGALRHWFSLHMALGLAGPALIVLHSRLELRSLNASIAFWSMALVAASGLVGRFLYRHVHHGLYGRRASLEELRARAGLGAEDGPRSWIRHLPAVLGALESYGREAEALARQGTAGPVALVRLAWSARRARRKALRTLRSELPILAAARRWDAQTLERRLRKGETLVHRYVAEAQGIAQLAAYERLFALWHVAHLPFVVMMVLAAVAHVVYVHMY